MGKHPEVKEKLWGGEFWSDGYFVSTASKYGNEEVIKNYVKKQGTEEEYTDIYKKQLELFD
jgi:REP element-mobilizing transposase RayT